MFGKLFGLGARLIRPLLGGGARKIGMMAAQKAKQAAIQLAKQKAAEAAAAAAASAARTVANKTGITNLVGEDLINQGANALGGEAQKQAGNFFQK
jgi:membrane protein involved in colicin uptake